MLFTDTNRNKNSPDIKKAETTQSNLEVSISQEAARQPTILCLLDCVFGNMVIHYSRSRVVHSQQGFEDMLELVREERLISESIKLIYLLVGRTDLQSASGSVVRALEKLLEGFARIQPRIMVVVGAVLILPSDTARERANLTEINQRIQGLMDGDHHWSFFNPNICISIAGEPQKRFFDRNRKLNKAGCRFVAQALVATSKSARMLQNFDLLPPK